MPTIGGFTILTLFLVVLAGILAGFVGYAVGASSLVSYPSLLACGIPPVLANATNTVGVVGTGIGGILGARRELRGQRLRMIVYIGIGLVGGVVGAWLLLRFDPAVFEHLVPPLILLSAVLIAWNPKGRAQAKQASIDVQRLTNKEKAPQSTIEPMRDDPWWVWLGVVFCGVYSGYFGAGAGTLGLAILNAGHVGSFHEINALKTVVGFGANVTASVVFICTGVVNWPCAIAMCVGCFIGSYVAPPITRRIPERFMRILAVMAAVALAVKLGVDAYL